MRAKRLIISNIGIIKETEISIDQPLICFWGSVRAGKSTVLNAVRWVFGGAYPSDIISHGQMEALIELELDNGSIRREFYLGKDGKVKDRPITFVRDGKPVKKPVEEIRKLLNPFLLDQDFLRKMSELERKQYFTELFAVDTADLDSEILEAESGARDLRNKIKGYGEIDLTEYHPISVSTLQIELAEVKARHKREEEAVIAENKRVALQGKEVGKVITRITYLQEEIERLNAVIAAHGQELLARKAWLEENPTKEELPLPEQPDTSSLEAQIMNASATNVKAEQYQKNLARANERNEDEKKLHALETRQRELKKEKISKLAEVNKNIPIPDLSFDENGNFTYKGTHAGMLSTSEVINLSTELSGLYPQELGIELLDRAESLGISVFDYVSIAIKRNTSILATIVGERPAKVPERVGVWVVEDGIVKKETDG